MRHATPSGESDLPITRFLKSLSFAGYADMAVVRSSVGRIDRRAVGIAEIRLVWQASIDDETL